jgi:hypothetical protein
LTFVYKKVFPVVFYGFLAIVAAVALPDAIQQKEVWFLLLVLLVLSAIGYVVIRGFLLDLVDEVYLLNDDLVVRNGGVEDRFCVSRILNVDSSTLTNPERITLTLREPCKFGETVTFAPPIRFGFGRHPLAAELIRLAHADPQR